MDLSCRAKLMCPLDISSKLPNARDSYEFDFEVLTAFTTNHFAGNPAAIVFLHRPLPDEILLKISENFNQPIVVYISPLKCNRAPQKGCAAFGLRWFGPRNEVRICGHGTLAAADAIFRRLDPSANITTLEFETLSGILTAHRVGDQICMDLPAGTTLPVSADETAVVQINSRFSDYGQLKLPLVNFIRPGRQIVVNLDQIGDRETGGRAKGSDLLLTDPQIMTYPYECLSLHDNLSDPVSRKIADGKDIFGGGNVGSVFENLPQQHVCNAYCSWFNLPVMKGLIEVNPWRASVRITQPARGTADRVAEGPLIVAHTPGALSSATSAICHHAVGYIANQRGALAFHMQDVFSRALAKPSVVIPYVGYGGPGFENYLFVEVEKSEDLREWRPNIDCFAELPSRTEILVVSSASKEPGIAYETRMFAPSIGVREDHVCGSAHCLNAPYWAIKAQGGQANGEYTKGKPQHAKAVSARGGDICAEYFAVEKRVRIRGNVKCVMVGRLTLDSELGGVVV
ncbi:hypothetical protein C8R45DRAFT_1174148 [Mycena sanguinolenta]|nr:hypothetical protein C8R45DRAFT_1174148 [Mycena sanguinolenta]